MSADQILQIVTASIVGLGGAIVAVFKFVDARTAQATAELRNQIEDLRGRVQALEDSSHQARGFLREARAAIHADDHEKAIELIGQAESLL